MRTLYSAPYLTIYLHAGSLPTLEVSWLGYASSAEFREAALLTLALGAEHRVQGWLTDDRRLGAVRPRDLEWVATTCLPQLATMGIKRFALLEAQDALNRRTIDAMYQLAVPQLSYEVRRFTDLPEARAWVTEAAL